MSGNSASEPVGIDAGVAEEIRRLRAKRDELAMRIGAAVVEHRLLLDRMMAEIRASGEREQEIAERELVRLGCAEERQDYRVTADGAVERLEAGAWIGVTR
jgi:hypothetical protein